EAPGCSRLGEQSRQLAAYVLVRREPRDVGAPHFEAPIADRGFAAMIEHEARIGTVAHEVDDLAQLVVRRAQIEDQPPPAHLAHAFHKGGLPAESGRLSLDILP